MNVVWTRRALRDIEAIGWYISSDNADAAARVVGRLLDRAESLARFPRQGRVVPEFDEKSIRELLIGSYRLVYRVRPDSVRILTVFEGHRLLTSRDLPPGE